MDSFKPEIYGIVWREDFVTMERSNRYKYYFNGNAVLTVAVLTLGIIFIKKTLYFDVF